MKLWTAALAAALVLGCGVQGDPPPTDAQEDDVIGQDSLPDGSNEAGQDVPDLPDASVGDEAPVDVPKTCETVLDEWQCIAQSACPEWAACLGVGGCEEPPCWGLCQDYPGACLPILDKTVCESEADCTADELCVGRVYGASPTDVAVPGLCRRRPSDVACWEDAHCPDGKHCAGEVVCRSGKLCNGPEFHGRCVDDPPAGQCWEHEDCTAPKSCVGVVWCVDGDAGCGGDTPGTCEAVNPAGCSTDEDCQGNPAGSFCTGAYSCSTAKCSIEDTPGYCSAPPGFGGCWEDSDCLGTVEPVCRASLACAPGTLCATMAAHVGQCGEAPGAGDGLAIGLAATSVVIGTPFWITLLNRGPSTIYVDPCLSLSFQRYNDNEKKWQYWGDAVAHHTCDQGNAVGLLAIPPGNGSVFSAVMGQFDAGKFRLEAQYQLGCVQGEQNPDCKTDALKVYSLDFESKPAGT